MTARLGIRPFWLHFVLAGVSALLLGLAFPPVGWSWLAFVALVPVAILALRSVSSRRLFGTTYLVSWAWWTVMIFWMWPVTQWGTVLLAGFMAIYLPLALLTFRWLHRRLNLAAVLALPLTWVSFELIRGYFLQGGFGWLALSHSQAPYLPQHGARRLIQIADLFGEHGVSFFIAMTSGLIVDLLTRPLVKPTASGKRRMSRTIRIALIGWAAAFIAVILYGQWRIAQFDAVTTPGPVVAVIQTNIPQDNKDSASAEQTAADWRRTIELTRQAAAVQPPPEIIIWPETITPAPINREATSVFLQSARIRESEGRLDEAAQWRQMAGYSAEIAQLAQERRAALLVGSSAQFYDETRRRFNSAFLFHADGSVAFERYDKIHRVPFGEYMPWVDWVPGLKEWFLHNLTPYDFDYTLEPGVSWTVFEVPRDAAESTGERASVRLVSPICFEDTVPRVIRRLVYGSDGRKRADMIVNLTNDGWFAHSSQPLQHFQIAVFRSVENRVPSARSVNTGMSGFIDSVGRIGPVVEADGKVQQIEGFAVQQVRLDERQTVFGRIGHVPGMILIGVTGVLSLVGVLRPDKMRR